MSDQIKENIWFKLPEGCAYDGRSARTVIDDNQYTRAIYEVDSETLMDISDILYLPVSIPVIVLCRQPEYITTYPYYVCISPRGLISVCETHLEFDDEINND